MSLKTDLTAVRALIDTPDKWRDVKGVIIAVGLAVHDRSDRATTVRAIRKIGITGSEPHPRLMELFDRAINAASIASLDAAIAECAKPLPRHT